MTISEDDKKLTFVPVIELEKPKKEGEYIADSWWIVHPERGAVFVSGYPQCNTQRRVAEIIQPKMYPWAEIQLIPIAYLPPRGH